ESFLPSEVALTTYLIMLIPFAFGIALYQSSRPRRMVSWACVFLGTICQFLTFSRAGLMSLLVETAAAAVIVKRRVILVMAVVFILSVGIGAGVLFHARNVSDKPIGAISDRKFDSTNL